MTRPSKTKPSPVPAAVSTKDLADILGVSTQRISQLLEAGVVFKADAKTYDLKSSVQGFIKFSATKKKNQWDSGGGEGEGYDEHRARLTKAKADIAEIQAETMKGNFHEAGAVEAVWTDMIMNTRSRLLAIPTRMAPLMRRETELAVIQVVLENGIREALQELSDYDPSKVTETYISTNRRDVEATIEANS